MTQRELLRLIASRLTDPDVLTGFRLGQADYWSDFFSKNVWSDRFVLDLITDELASEPFTTRERFGVVVGWLLARFTHAEGASPVQLSPFVPLNLGQDLIDERLN